MTRVLLINSDLASNRGDRAIAEGIIQLVRERWPDAEITGISQFPERDHEWYGINFIDMNFQSLSPFELIRLGRAARRHDVVLWGGGEILKDYTNKAALWYWVMKISFLLHFNRHIYGAFQGIGPTASPRSRRMIARIAGKCERFIVRDSESRDKLIAWGADPARVIASSDPAVVPRPDALSNTLRRKLVDDKISSEFLENSICIGPRDWFHYSPGGVIPFKYKRKIAGLVGKSLHHESPEHTRYLEQLQSLTKEISERYHVNILLTPMHMTEGDTALCQQMAAAIGDDARVRVLANDQYSPTELRTVIGQCTAMLGFRLHSTIVGTSAGVPSATLYYVDKGRVYFDQIGQARYAVPIERVLDESFHDEFFKLFDELYANRAAIHSEIDAAVDNLRATVRSAFSEVFPR